MEEGLKHESSIHCDELVSLRKSARAVDPGMSVETFRIVQTGSPIRRHHKQRETLIGLGLNKMHKTRELQDSPEVRGMIRKVSHMVSVEG